MRGNFSAANFPEGGFYHFGMGILFTVTTSTIEEFQNMRIEEVEKDSTLKGCNFLKIYKHMTYFQGHAATLPTSCQSHTLNGGTIKG